MRDKKKRSLHWLLLGLALVCAGCTVKSSSTSGPGQVGATCGTDPPEILAKKKQAYASTLYPVLRASGSPACIGCHIGTNGLAPFPHCSDDLTQAYQAAAQLVNFQNPTSSTLVTQVLSGHNCGSGQQCTTLANQIAAQIQAWSQLQASLPATPPCPGNLDTGLTINLSSQGIPVSLAAPLSATPPKPAAVTNYRWDIGSQFPDLAPMLLSVDVQAVTAPSSNGKGAYNIQNLILATGQLRVRLVSLIPVINGALAPQYSNYTNPNFVVGAQSYDSTATVLGFPPLAPNVPQQIAWQNSDSDSLGFQMVLEQTSELPSTTTQLPTCKRPDLFKQVYDNVLNLQIVQNGTVTGQCTVCHGSAGQAANAVMNLSNTTVDACLQVLMRVKLSSPTQSLFVQKPSWADSTASLNNGSRHPVRFGFVGDVNGDPADAALNGELGLMQQWMCGEAAAAGMPCH